MKTKLISTIIIYFILHSCIIDKIYDNITIKNQSDSYIAYVFLRDTTKAETWIYYLIQNMLIAHLRIQ